MSAELEDPDKKKWDDLVKSVAAANDLVSDVGFFADDEKDIRDDGQSNTLIASVHVFGTDRVPQRDFMRPAFDQNEKALENLASDEFDKALEGKITSEEALDEVGAALEREVFGLLVEGVGPALAAETVRRKGSSIRLRDTDQMLDAITRRTGKK